MKFTIAVTILTISSLSCMSQLSTNFPCYAISSIGNDQVLFGFSPEELAWFKISSTQTNNIVTIAADSDNKILYAFESGTTTNVAGTFGIFDAATRNFVPIGTPGNGNGDYGEILLNNITGLAYSNATNTVFAVHNITENDGQTNDLLFQIDVSTGKVLTNTMRNNFGFPSDYSIIEEVFDDDNFIKIFNVKDIAIEPKTGDLFAVYAYQNSNSLIKIINMEDGTIEKSIYDVYEENLQALAFTFSGNLYATIGDNAPNQNKLLYIDYSSGNTTLIDEPNLDFKSFDCFKNDVDFGTCTADQFVLKNTIASGIYQSVTVNDDINTENRIEENSTVVVAAKELITLQNIFIPASSNFIVEVRPCGL